MSITPIYSLHYGKIFWELLKEDWHGFKVLVKTRNLTISNQDGWLFIEVNNMNFNEVRVEASSQEFADSVLTTFLLTRDFR